MPYWRRLVTLWRNLAHKQNVDADLDDELRSYREMLEAENGAHGADPDTARRQALLALGGAEQIKEEVRDVRVGASLETILTEVRHALRGLRRNPSLAILACAMLALGMGASIVMFSIFYAALIQPLPFRDPESLVQIWETRLDRGFSRNSFTEANFWDVREQNRTFEEVAALHYDDVNLTGLGQAEKVAAIQASRNLLRTLGVAPVVGRDFSEDDERAGNRVVLLGNGFWKTRFGADAKVLGTMLRLNDKAFTVIGVLPPGEPWLDEQIYTPFAYRADADRGSWEYNVIGRLRPGVSMEAAQADLKRVADVLERTYPKETTGIGFRMASSTVWVASDTTRRALWVLLAAVTFLLLIACLNIANLLLARGTARQREIAVRTALGAGRLRLIRFVMMESLLLSVFGCVLGLALAYTALRVIQTMEINGIPRLADASLNPWVLAYAVSAALLTGIFSGLAPALQVPSTGLVHALRDGERQTGSRAQGRLRAALVTGEVALSFLLLVGAGLLIRSFTHLMQIHHGFQTEHRLLFSVSMPASYWDKGVGKQFLDRFYDRLRALPEVIAAGSVNQRPVAGGDPGMGVDAASGPLQASRKTVPWAGWRIVSPDYFKAIGLPLLRGRSFTEEDRPVWANRSNPNPQRRVVISQRLAKLLFAGEDAVGKHVLLWKGQANLEAEVIGVAGDSRERGLANDPALTVYIPYGVNALTPEFVVHTRGNPLALVTAIRSIVTSLDPNLPVADVRQFEEVVHRSVAPQRFSALLLAVFSAFALVLATTGIYGVLSYSMSRRTSEIGLRVALGASGGSILGMTIRQGLRPVLLGILLGAIGASWLSRYFTTLLYGTEPLDLLTFAAVAAILLLTAIAACYLPGRRAMSIDPAVALRTE